jgi:sarcosine oxidase
MTLLTKYVVVGAGLAGAATAWSLARRGHEVTVLERTRPAAPDGSSHGSARIFRYAYPSPFYSQLVVESRKKWEDVEARSGCRLITPTGALDFGPARDTRAIARVLEQVGVEHELLARDEAHNRWPGISFDTDVLWHPDAGVLDAESAVTAFLTLARAEGAQLLTDWPVTGVSATQSGYLLTSATGRRLTAERVVVAAGGWLPNLLAHLPLPSGFVSSLPSLAVRQEQVYHFPYREQLGEGSMPAHGPQPMPTFIHKSPWIQTYGLPGGRDAQFRGHKLAEFNGGKPLQSAADQDGVVDPVNRSRLVNYVRQYLPGLVPEPYAERTCLFTNTPTEDFLIDGSANITIVSPCSGHGAKFAPLIGEIAAGVATGDAPAAEIFRARTDAATSRESAADG